MERAYICWELAHVHRASGIASNDHHSNRVGPLVAHQVDIGQLSCSEMLLRLPQPLSLLRRIASGYSLSVAISAKLLYELHLSRLSRFIQSQLLSFGLDDGAVGHAPLLGNEPSVFMDLVPTRIAVWWYVARLLQDREVAVPLDVTQQPRVSVEMLCSWKHVWSR